MLTLLCNRTAISSDTFAIGSSVIHTIIFNAFIGKVIHNIKVSEFMVAQTLGLLARLKTPRQCYAPPVSLKQDFIMSFDIPFRS